MSAAFGRLLAVFGFELPRHEAARVDEVVGICELIDRFIDENPDEPARAAASDAVDRALGGEDAGLPAELAAALARFRAAFDDPAAARATLRRICDEGARARAAEARSPFVRAVRAEGRAFSALFVPLLGPHVDARFVDFFLELGEVANLVDKLVDARADAARGELRLRPGVRHHARLAGEVARDGLALLARAPDRVAFARWAAWFLRPAHHESARL